MLMSAVRRTSLLLIGLLATPALAHSGGAHLHGFAAGFVHPLFGWDHLLAMLAVGIWSAQQGGVRRVLLPACFVAAMAVGGALGMAGVQLGFTETAIAVSVLALGVLIALARTLPAPLGAALCIVAAVCHGLAHGGELPLAASATGYVLGFLLATAGLHLAGIALALRLRTFWLRGFGLLAGLAGSYLLLA